MRVISLSDAVDEVEQGGGGQAASDGLNLRARVPEVADEVMVRIREEIPRLTGGNLAALLEELVGHFAELLHGSQPPPGGLLERVRRAGQAGADRGESPAVFQEAVRLGTGIAIARLSEHAGRLGTVMEVGAMGRAAQAVFACAEQVCGAYAAGHMAAGPSASERIRRALAELVLDPDADAREVDGLARRVGWKPPARVVVVALPPDRTEPLDVMFPSEVLTAPHRSPECVIVPDLAGPEARRRMEMVLRGRPAAVGPAVALAEAATSLRWAERTLELMRDGVVVPHGVVFAADQLPLLLLGGAPELLGVVAADRLSPLASVRGPLRHELAITLLALLEHHFRAHEVAKRLHLHPQTVRYRLRKLEALFGGELYDPRRQLETHMLLHAQLKGVAPRIDALV